jgi:hypothetical protein
VDVLLQAERGEAVEEVVAVGVGVGVGVGVVVGRQAVVG